MDKVEFGGAESIVNHIEVFKSKFGRRLTCKNRILQLRS